MKYLYLILSIIAVLLVIFNMAHINFSEPFEGESLIAIISVLLGLCALMLLIILHVSKKIVEKGKQKESNQNYIDSDK